MDLLNSAYMFKRLQIFLFQMIKDKSCFLEEKAAYNFGQTSNKFRLLQLNIANF